MKPAGKHLSDAISVHNGLKHRVHAVRYLVLFRESW